MNEYTLNIRLRSSVITPFQSDTLFGHICWAVRYLWGNNSLKSFLDKYNHLNDSTQDMPLLISNGFPKGYLPKPILSSISQNELERILDAAKLQENSYKIKFIKKFDLVPITLLKSLAKDDLTPVDLFRRMYEEFDLLQALDKSRIWAAIRHNTVNRIKNKVEEGLFDQEECFVKPDTDLFTIYIKSISFSKVELETIFGFIGENGYGKDKHTGKGHFIVQDIQEGLDLPEWEKPDAYMTLSSFIPKQNDPTNGYYRFIQKYGKTGELFAKEDKFKGNPFKRPMLMFAAGSTFLGKAPSGIMVNDVHYSNKDIKQYAYAFPMGIRMKEDKDENY